MKLNKLLTIGLSSILLIGTATAKKDDGKDKDKPKAPRKTFAELDTDKDGKVSEAEFVAPAPEKAKDKMKERFAKKDKDKDGFLTEEEFKSGRPDKKGPKKGPKKKKK